MNGKIEEKKIVWLNAMGDYVLENGLKAASLRPLAKAAGTSDRMLIYHFGTKDELITQLLKYLFERLGRTLKSAFPTDRAKSRADCALNIMSYNDASDYKAYMKVWLEVVASSAYNDSIFASIGKTLTNDLEEWIVSYLPENDPNPKAAARAILTLVEGANVLSAVGQTDKGKEAISFLLDN